ncbi:MAG: hypothetical protein U1G08_16205 [Verrucomicrobiota bacterium]
MNLHVPHPAALAALLLTAPFVHASDPIHEALQRGLLAEEAQRDLVAAADAYAEAVRLGDEERGVMATALFRLAEAQRRLGRTNEAAIGYRRLRRDFSEWTNLTAITLSRDSALDSTSTGLSRLQGDHDRALAELQSLRNRSSELDALRTLATNALSATSDADASGALAAANPTPELNRLRTEYHLSEIRLATLRNDFGPQHPDRVKEEAVLKTLQHQLQQEIQGILQSLELRTASLNREMERQERRLQVLALQRKQEEKSMSDLESAAETVRGTPEDYLRQEIDIAELQVKRLEELKSQGIVGTEAVLTARRELLALKRQLAGLHLRDVLLEPVPKTQGPGSSVAGTADPTYANGTNAVAVIGAVGRPGMIAIPVGRTMDLVELIARSGDLTRNAARNRIRVHRDGKTLEVGLDQAMAQRFDLQPGDRVEVPERVF